MSNWLDKKYIGMVSSRLTGFKQVDAKTYNFKCPLCGDSHTNKSKQRGYFFEKDDGEFMMFCHNCGASMGFNKLLEQIDPNLYREYSLESLKEKGITPKRKVKSDVEKFADKMKKPVFVKTTALNKLKKISQLPYNHPAKVYVARRQIPNKYHSKLFYAPKFKKFVNTIVPDKFDDSKDEPRLIIPFIDKDKKLIGFQGRSFNPKSKLRYITIMIDETAPKIFNLDEVDQSQPHYVFEGPIDSMFVKNSIAMAGGSVDINYLNDNSIFVYDNEPRKKETCDKIKKIIEKGYKVSLFPEGIEQKDINDMVLSNKNLDIDKVLRDNVFQHLQAMMIFNNWKRV